MILDLSNPQSWNRYSYVSNNPIRLTDPSGHKCVGDDDACVDGGGGTGPICYPGELACQLARGDHHRNDDNPKSDTQLSRAIDGDLWSILDLVVPTHVGIRIQGEVTFAPPWLPPWLGVSVTVPGINLMYHRPDNDLTLFVDGGTSGGPGFTGGKFGIGGSVTGGLIVGWGSSQSKEISDGSSWVFNASAHAEDSYAATVSSNLQKDKRYGIVPTTIYAGTGVGCCYASIGTGASYSIPLGNIKLPDFFRGIVGNLIEQHHP